MFNNFNLFLTLNAKGGELIWIIETVGGNGFEGFNQRFPSRISKIVDEAKRI